MNARPCLVLAVVVLAGSHLAAADNPVPNSGFESGLEGWEFQIGPECRGLGAVAEGKASGEAAHGGRASARMSSDMPLRYGLSTSAKSPIPLAAGGRYRVSAWVKCGPDARPQSGAALLYVRLALMEGPGQATRDPLGNLQVGLDGRTARTRDIAKLASVDLPAEWRKIEGVVEVPPNQTGATVGLFVERLAGTVYWDDVAVEAVEASTPLSPAAGTGP